MTITEKQKHKLTFYGTQFYFDKLSFTDASVIVSTPTVSDGYIKTLSGQAQREIIVEGRCVNSEMTFFRGLMNNLSKEVLPITIDDVTYDRVVLKKGSVTMTDQSFLGFVSMTFGVM